MLIMQATLQEELCRQYLLHLEADQHDPQAANVQGLQNWLKNDPRVAADKTMKVIIDLIQSFQHRELLHQVLAQGPH
jgi:hypothetical protein